jgi:hypothetical protein
MEHLGLSATVRRDAFPHWAAAECPADNIILRLEYERGLLSFCVASTFEPNLFWPVEFIAELFPRVRLMSGGFQRLSIEEQSTFLRQHLTEIKELFSSEHYPVTREKLQSVHK